MTYELILGDCREVMATMPADSIDSIVCDPPYGLSFMGKGWDHGVPGVPFWEAALRVAKPGAMLLAFGGDRTHHRLMVAIEDAGWEIRTCLYWVTGQGFPKSINIGKAIRKQFSADVLCACDQHSTQTTQDSQGDCPEYHRSHDGQLHVDQDNALSVFPSPSDVRARNHADLGGDVQASAQANSGPGATNDHPSNGGYSRPLARPSSGFPLSETVLYDMPLNNSYDATMVNGKTDSRKLDIQRLGLDSVSSALPSPDNVTHSNIPHCTTCGKPIASAWDGFGSALKPAAEIIVMAMKPLDGTFAHNALKWGVAGINVDASRIPTSAADAAAMDRCNTSGSGRFYGSAFAGDKYGNPGTAEGKPLDTAQGRWPANLLLDDSDEVAALFPQTAGGHSAPNGAQRKSKFFDGGWQDSSTVFHADKGGASRFFYVAKASKRDRDEGLEGMPTQLRRTHGDTGPSDNAKPNGQTAVECRNSHPTVKPTQLMRYLVRLVTPPGGTTLDPFAGSGSTLKAAILEGFNCVGIEISEEYHAIAERRIQDAAAQPMLLEVP